VIGNLTTYIFVMLEYLSITTRERERERKIENLKNASCKISNKIFSNYCKKII